MFCFVFFFSKLLSDAVRIIFDRYKIHKNCKRRNRNQDVLLLSFHGQYLFVWVKEILHETHACIHVNTHDFMKEITEWLCLNLRPSITLAWVMMIFFICVSSKRRFTYLLSWFKGDRLWYFSFSECESSECLITLCRNIVFVDGSLCNIRWPSKPPCKLQLSVSLPACLSDSVEFSTCIYVFDIPLVCDIKADYSDSDSARVQWLLQTQPAWYTAEVRQTGLGASWNTLLTQSNLLWAAADNWAVVKFSNGGMKFTAAYRAGMFPVGHYSGPSKLSVGPATIDDWKCLVVVHCRLEVLFSIFAVGMTNRTPPE